MEAKLNHVLSYYFNLFHADMLQRAINDESVTLEEFIAGFEKIQRSERNTDEDEFMPDEFKKMETENPKQNQEKSFKISYVLGTEAVQEYNECVDSCKKWNISSLCDCGSVSHGEFATQAELDAYIQGVEDATGWLESERMMTDKEWKEYLKKYFSDEDDNDD